MTMLLVLAALAQQPEPVEAARAYREENGARILEEFTELLSIPNVSADLPNVRRNAAWIVAAFARRGVPMRLLEIDGVPPLVYGRLDVTSPKRTLGIYVHYDGQPVDPSRWSQPPFTPTLYTAAIEAGGRPRPLPAPGEAIDPEWRLYARGSGDDRAPIAAVLAALDALRVARIAPTANLVFLFEGEEEAGSDHLGAYLKEHRELLDVDAWLICDGPVHQSRRPQLVFGVRGYTGLEVTVYGATRNLHSGHYGNWAPNPALMLARLLAGMKDDAGRVLVEGFYDSVRPPTAAERAALQALPDHDAALRAELGLRHTEAEDAPYVERLMLPSLNVRGLESATVGDSARNIIPRTATASIDIRLVPDNDPNDMLDLVEAHIRAQGYAIVREPPDLETRRAHRRIALVERRPGYRAVRAGMDHPLLRRVAAAVEAAAGEPPFLLPTLGGSLPLYLFTDLLGDPVVILPIANHDDNQHAPDENLRLANLWYGIDVMAAVLTME